MGAALSTLLQLVSSDTIPFGPHPLGPGGPIPHAEEIRTSIVLPCQLRLAHRKIMLLSTLFSPDTKFDCIRILPTFASLAHGRESLSDSRSFWRRLRLIGRPVFGFIWHTFGPASCMRSTGTHNPPFGREEGRE
jgi:hypothetical protein